MKKKVWVCDTCGSDLVYADAWVGLNDPDDIKTFDNLFCEDCEGETSVSEVTVEEESE